MVNRLELKSVLAFSVLVQFKTVLSHFHQKTLKSWKKTSKSVRRHWNSQGLRKISNDYFNGWNWFRAELNWTDSEPKFQFGSSLTENRLQPYLKLTVQKLPHPPILPHWKQQQMPHKWEPQTGGWMFLSSWWWCYFLFKLSLT